MKIDLAPGASLDVVERQPERARDRPADLKGPGLLVDHGAVVMGDAEEPLVRRQPGVQVLPLGQVLDNAGGRVGNGRRLVGPGNDLLARAGRERPGQGGAENRQSGEGRTAVGEKVAAEKVIRLHCCLHQSSDAKTSCCSLRPCQGSIAPEQVVWAVLAPRLREALRGVLALAQDRGNGLTELLRNSHKRRARATVSSPVAGLWRQARTPVSPGHGGASSRFARKTARTKR